MQYIENSRRGWILRSVVCKVLCFYLPPSWSLRSKPTGVHQARLDVSTPRRGTRRGPISERA
nr:MAG TPA: hypothetical protein [Caudoviricetes sp.]